MLGLGQTQRRRAIWRPLHDPYICTACHLSQQSQHSHPLNALCMNPKPSQNRAEPQQGFLPSHAPGTTAESPRELPHITYIKCICSKWQPTVILFIHPPVFGDQRMKCSPHTAFCTGSGLLLKDLAPLYHITNQHWENKHTHFPSSALNQLPASDRKCASDISNPILPGRQRI